MVLLFFPKEVDCVLTEKRHLFLLLFTFFFLFPALKQGFKHLVAASQRLSPWQTPWRKDRAPQRHPFFCCFKLLSFLLSPFCFCLILIPLSCSRSRVQPWMCRIPSPQPNSCTQIFWPGLEGRNGLWFALVAQCQTFHCILKS